MLTAGRRVQIIRFASNAATSERNHMIIGEYKTLLGKAEILDEKVNAAIKEGFQPYGNLYTISLGLTQGTTTALAQAMVKPASGAFTAKDIGGMSSKET